MYVDLNHINADNVKRIMYNEQCKSRKYLGMFGVHIRGNHDKLKKSIRLKK